MTAAATASPKNGRRVFRSRAPPRKRKEAACESKRPQVKGGNALRRACGKSRPLEIEARKMTHKSRSFALAQSYGICHANERRQRKLADVRAQGRLTEPPRPLPLKIRPSSMRTAWIFQYRVSDQPSAWRKAPFPADLSFRRVAMNDLQSSFKLGRAISTRDFHLEGTPAVL